MTKLAIWTVQAAGVSSAVFAPASDIYSLGVMLYQFLTGKLPFNGTHGEIIAQILRDHPRPPSAVRPGVDFELEAICRKMMAKQIAERPGSMKEVAEALQDYLRRASLRKNLQQDVHSAAEEIRRAAPLNGLALIVDDNPYDRARLKSVLKDLGLGVVEGADGEEGLELARSHAVDLILLDNRMPGMGGGRRLG